MSLILTLGLQALTVMLFLAWSSSIGWTRMAISGQLSASSIFHAPCLSQSAPRYPYDSDAQSNTVELIHDAFQDLSYWNGWQASPEYSGVAMDTHIYQMFSDSVRRFFALFLSGQHTDHAYYGH